MSAFSVALTEHERGAASSAMDGYRAAIRQGGTNLAAAYSNLGTLLSAAGRHAESVHASAAAAAAAPRNPTILYNLANARMEASLDAEAVSIFRRVVRIERRHAPSYHNLAILLHRAGDSAAALGFFRAALACGEEQLATIGGAAQVYANMAYVGLLDDSSAAAALAAQRQSAKLAPHSPAAQVRLAERLLDPPLTTARAAEAEVALESAVRLAPDDAHALNLLGTLLQSLPGRWREATRAYRAAIAARPEHGDAYHNLGTVQQRLGRLDEARALYLAALPLAPGVANVYVSLASLSAAPENARLLRYAIALQPNELEGHLRLAAALAPAPLGAASPPAEAAVFEAIDVLGRAAALAPADPRPRAQLGRLRLGLASSWAWQAEADLVAAASLQPASAEAHNAAGLLLRLGNRPERAHATLSTGFALARAAAAAADGSSSGGGPRRRRRSGVAGGVARDGIDWLRASTALEARGYWVLDAALGDEAAAAIESDVRTRLLPLMSAGRVGDGLESSGVRSDRLWRHRRDDASVLDVKAPHVGALHALFDLLPIGLNQLPPMVRNVSVSASVAVGLVNCAEAEQGKCEENGGGSDGNRGSGGGGSSSIGSRSSSSSSLGLSSSPSFASGGVPPWALTRVEDLQFACYVPGGFYKQHSDAQDAKSRRVLTAIYYMNSRWRTSDGGWLRVRDRTGALVDIEPLADRVVLFDSRLEHEVLPVTPAAAPTKKKKKKAHEAPLRCAVTQWFQDMAPPLLESILRGPGGGAALP